MKKDLIEICQRHRYGICPRCGSPLKLIVCTYDGYDMYSSGLVSGKFGEMQSKKAICPECGFQMKMIDTIDGLIPADLTTRTPDYEVDKDNPIGIVEEEE